MKISGISRNALGPAVCLAALVFFALDPSSVAAQTQYQPLESFPGFEQETAGGDFPGYVQALYRLGLWIVGIAAMFMLTVGAFMYLSSAGNNSTMGTAKKVMTDAIMGLIIALVAWLILNTINPDLVTMKFGGMNASSGNGTGTAPKDPDTPSVPQEGTYSHDEAVKVLSGAGIQVVSSGNCSDPNNKSCTSLEQIPKEAVANLISLKEKSNCSFSVSGGTETGHKSHGLGKPKMDVKPEDCLGDFLHKNKGDLATYGVNQICTTPGWQKISYNCGSYMEDPSKPHIHLGL
jgi:hypothetical protein